MSTVILKNEVHLFSYWCPDMARGNVKDKRVDVRVRTKNKILCMILKQCI